MKKVFMLFLVAVLCFSLAACVGGKMPNANDNSTHEQQEQNDSKEPEASEPRYTAVELTVENWDTYFEFVEHPVFKENEFGEVSEMTLEYRFQLKDVYFDRLNPDETAITVEISYSYGRKYIVADFDTQSYTLEDYVLGRSYPSSRMTDDFDYKDNHFYTTDLFGVFTTCYKDSEYNDIMTYTDFEVLRIEGTLCLTEE